MKRRTKLSHMLQLRIIVHQCGKLKNEMLQKSNICKKEYIITGSYEYHKLPKLSLNVDEISEIIPITSFVLFANLLYIVFFIIFKWNNIIRLQFPRKLPSKHNLITTIWALHLVYPFLFKAYTYIYFTTYCGFCNRETRNIVTDRKNLHIVNKSE